MNVDLPQPKRGKKRQAPEPTKETVEQVFKEDTFHQKDEERIVLEAIPERQLVDNEGNPEERKSGVLNFITNGWDDVYKHAQMVKIWEDTGKFISVATEMLDNCDDDKKKKELLDQLDWAQHQHGESRKWLEMAEQYKTVRQ